MCGLRKLIDDLNFINYLRAFDIIGLIETWGNYNMEFESLLDNYTCFDFVREKSLYALRNSGGVSVFIKNSFIKDNFITRICHDYLDCIVLYIKSSVFRSMRDIVLYIAYVSPEGSPIYNNRDELNGINYIDNNILTLRHIYPDVYLYLAGDFNARTSNLIDYIPDDSIENIFNTDIYAYNSDCFEQPRNNKDSERTNSFGKSLIELCCSHSIHILNGRMHEDVVGNYTCLTYNGASVVDYHVISSELFSCISYFNIEMRGESDHMPLCSRLSFFVEECCNNTTSILPDDNNFGYVDKYKWNSDHRDEFLTMFLNNCNTMAANISFEIDSDINSAVDKILELYRISAINMRVKYRKEVKTSKCNSNNQPWWDRTCDLAKQLKYAALRRFRWTSTMLDLQNYITLRKQFKTTCYLKKQEHQCAKREELILARKNPKAFWKLLKDCRRSNISNTPDVDPNSWRDYFRGLLFKEDQPCLLDLEWGIETVNEEYDQVLNSTITEEEITKSILKIKNGKSQGTDGFGAEFFKNTRQIITPLLHSLFNKIFSTGIFPEVWRDSIIVPVHKSGSKEDPSNYRGVALINVMYKIFANIIYDRLYTWSEEFGKIDESQAGFRVGYSTIDNIFTLQSMVQKYISKPGGRFYVLYVDFKKAFDGLIHHKLFASLHRKGVQGNLFKILISMYSNLRGAVKVGDGKLSQSFHCNVGTRQGDVTSTIIFNLYINELSSFLRSKGHRGIFITEQIADIICILFADDVANCADTAVELQSQLNSIAQFCEDTGMTINQQKTEIIVFRNGGPLRTYEKWFYNNSPVNVTSMYKFMGLIFTPKLAWSKAQSKLAAQARKSIYAIMAYQKSFGAFSHNEYFKLFDSMVKPILTYGAEIYGTEACHILERVQIQYCKHFLGVNSYVNNSVALGECGRLPLCIDHHIKCIKYWFKLLAMPDARYPKNCYIMLKRHDEIGRQNWASAVKNLLYRYGFGIVWLSQEVGDVNNFICVLKQRLIDCMNQIWHDNIQSSTRCDTYKHFKTCLNPERYLCLNLPFYVRKSLARFRCSSHKFAIETGRHFAIPREDRICRYCFINFDIECIEDEFHVFFKCYKYRQERQTFIHSWYAGGNEFPHFINLMQSLNVDRIKYVAFYVNAIMKLKDNE